MSRVSAWHADHVFTHVAGIIYIATAQRVGGTWRNRSWTLRIERGAVKLRGPQRMPAHIRAEVDRARRILEDIQRAEDDDTEAEA